MPWSGARSQRKNHRSRGEPEPRADTPIQGSQGGPALQDQAQQSNPHQEHPDDVTKAEIIHPGILFGRVTNVLVLKGRNQVFLEMEEEVFTVTIVNRSTNCVAQLQERSVHVQFSNNPALKTYRSRSNTSAAQALASAGANKVSGGPNTVLRVIMKNTSHPRRHLAGLLQG